MSTPNTGPALIYPLDERGAAGPPAAGTLELLLANPVSRARVAAGRACALLALVHAAVAFAVGATTGSRPLAAPAASAVAVAGFVVQGRDLR